MTADSPFHATLTSPRPPLHTVISRRPILSRAVRSDVVTPRYGPVLVWGEPLIGKTTLIRQVLWSLEPYSFLAARIPVGALAEPISGRNRATPMLANQYSLQLEAAGAGRALLGDTTSLPDLIDRCIELASSHALQVVLVIEGIDRYSRDICPQGVLSHLHGLLARSDELSLIFTSRQPPYRMDLVDLSDVRMHFVTPLNREEAQRLLAAPLEDRLEIDEDALEPLLSAAGGRPFLIQIIGRNCSRIAHAQGTTCLTGKQAEEIINSCWPAAENIFRPLIGSMKPASQVVLAATATSTSPRNPVATLEMICLHTTQMGLHLDLEQTQYVLDVLRSWQIVDSPGPDLYRLMPSWLAVYLRAGMKPHPGGVGADSG